MRPKVLALDYDGTIARDGRLDADVRAAIGEVRARGLLVVLVTGRILDELREVVGGLDFVDAIVAENGAVYTVPRTGQSHLIGRPASRMFLAECRRRGIGVRAGECIVEADAEAAPAILSVIRELELPLVLLFNRGRLMVLPQAISKSTGLRELLTALRRSVHNTIGVGDAENDHELLTACEVGVAVAWGSAALKAAADEVLEGTGPEAVAPFIRGLIAGRSSCRRARRGAGSCSATRPMAPGSPWRCAAATCWSRARRDPASPG